MRQVTSYSGKRVAVLGLGRSGLSAATALAAGGADVHAWDDSDDRRSEAVEAGIPLSDLYAAPLDGYAALVLSPGIPLHHPEPHPLVKAARNADCEIIGDIELFVRERLPGKTVAITGTNGKSTTTVLTGHLLKSCGVSAAVGGNVGVPVLDLPDVSSDGIYVVEMSSYQIDLTPSLAADVAVLLNISPDHLDRHGGMSGYVAAKRQLLDRQRPDQTAIVGLDDAESLAIYNGLKQSGRDSTIAISAGTSEGADIFVRDGFLHDRMTDAPDTSAPTDLNGALDLKGVHNWQNAAAAYAVARSLGCPSTDIAAALLSFPGLAHRMEDLGTVAGVRFVNDSKATNVEAAARALACYGNIVWIAGGRAKEGGLRALHSYFPKVLHAFLIGEAANDFAAELDGRVEATVSGDLGSAVSDAHAYAVSHGLTEPVVLLSPACASFDQFSDFEARGNRFKELVRALGDFHDGADAAVGSGGVQ